MHCQAFWLDQALSQNPAIHATGLRQTLTGKHNTQVAIVGGGYTGLWSAIMLKQAQPNLKVCVLEQGICGQGASGRNGGAMLTFSSKYPSLLARFGPQQAAFLVTQSESSAREIADFCTAHNIEAEVRLDGCYYTATNHSQMASMPKIIASLTRAGLNQWSPVEASKVAIKTGSSQHLQAHYHPNAGSLHPGKLVLGLKAQALKLGVEIFEQTPMDKLKGTQIVTPGGSLQADKVILATNAWMPGQFKAFSRAVVLVSSDILITKPMPQALSRIGLVHGAAVIDGQTFVHYYRTTEDGRLMLGKGGNVFAYANRMLKAFDQASRFEDSLLKAFRHFFPSLPCEFERSWCGPSDRSVTGLPMFGELKPNVYYGFGYSGNGVVQSHMGGKILSGLVLGKDTQWTRCALVNQPQTRFPCEPFRFLGAQVIAAAIRRKEQALSQNKRPLALDNYLASLANFAGKADG